MEQLGGRRKDGMSRMLLSNAMANLQLETIQNTDSPPSRLSQPSDTHLLRHLGQELTSVLQPASSDPGHCEHPVHAQNIPPGLARLCVCSNVHLMCMLLQCCSVCQDTLSCLCYCVFRTKGSMNYIYREEALRSIRPVISKTTKERRAN